jgi:hypothetical protein
MPSRIEDYALIGDCQTAALVATTEAGATPMRVNVADLRIFPGRSGVPTEIAYPASLDDLQFLEFRRTVCSSYPPDRLLLLSSYSSCVAAPVRRLSMTVALRTQRRWRARLLRSARMLLLVLPALKLAAVTEVVGQIGLDATP